MEMSTEPKHRISMKQNTKGHWSAEFSVRGETIDEIKDRFQTTKQFVLEEVKYLNAKNQIEKDAESEVG